MSTTAANSLLARVAPPAPSLVQQDLVQRIRTAVEQSYVVMGSAVDLPVELDLNGGRDELAEALYDVTEGLRSWLKDGQRSKLATICSMALELQALERELHAERLQERLRVLTSVQEGLSCLRGVDSVAQILDKAMVELCHSCGFDRAVLFRVDGSALIGESVHFPNDPGWTAEFLRFTSTQPAPLSHLMLETEMIRRRMPMLVLDAQNDPRTYKPFVRAAKTTSYVAAPIMPEDRVIGFLHADRYTSGQEVDELDRDALWTFAEGFGYAFERTMLLERLQAQRAQLRSTLVSADAIVTEFCEAEVELVRSTSEGAAVARTAAAMFIAPESRIHALLTRREIEVLKLMGQGATNMAIASRLVSAEGTVKSHVKRILRKLHAANRAEAVSRYMSIVHSSPGGSGE